MHLAVGDYSIRRVDIFRTVYVKNASHTGTRIGVNKHEIATLCSGLVVWINCYLANPTADRCVPAEFMRDIFLLVLQAPLSVRNYLVTNADCLSAHTDVYTRSVPQNLIPFLHPFDIFHRPIHR